MEGFFLAEVTGFGGSFAPRGWTNCEGQILAITQFEALFSIVGTIYGGDGRTTFGLPDLRGRVPVGASTSAPGLTPYRIGTKGGQENVTLTTAQIPSHTHAPPATSLEASNASADDPVPGAAVNFARGNSAFGDIPQYAAGPADTSLPGPTGTSDPTGGTNSHSNLQPSLVIRYVIALQGIYPTRN